MDSANSSAISVSVNRTSMFIRHPRLCACSRRFTKQTKNSAASGAALSNKTILSALFSDVAQSHFDALMNSALVTRRSAGLDIALARRPVDQRKSAIHDRLEVARLFGSERPAHSADLVAES